jgi:uncharacterized protein (TIGR02646 family)
MQFIQKEVEAPTSWNDWFTVPPNRRTYVYAKNYAALDLKPARAFLLKEQNSLCAYCQQKISPENASIEHVIPKSHNQVLSTVYYNVVAVCNKNQIKDYITGRFHCDRSRGNALIPSIIFYKNARSTIDRPNQYFEAYADGMLIPRNGLQPEIKSQVQAFIDLLNLNYQGLKIKRKEYLDGILAAFMVISGHQKNVFWSLNYKRILDNPRHEFREFLLIYFWRKIRQ